MNITKLKLTNFRSFEEFELDLNPGFNLVIGDNAKGKTTILDALAVGIGSLFLGFPEPAKSKGIKTEDIRHKFFESGQRITSEAQYPCQVHCEGSIGDQSGRWMRERVQPEGRTTWGDANWIHELSKTVHAKIQNGDQSEFLPAIAHYGTERLWKQLSFSDTKILSPESRFSGYVDCLNPASNEKRLFEWFKTAELTALQNGKPLEVLEACRMAIVGCIPDVTHAYYDVSFDQLILTTNDGTIPFGYLSDGYRNMLAVVADLAVKCATLNPQMGKEATLCQGVVLIDEIDLHLHPKWQRRVVSDLMKVFPNIQFVATTHSPFIIQSLPPNQKVKLINLDGSELDHISDRSVEEIVEWVQGVEMPQRSQRHIDMMKTAEEYFTLLDDDAATTDEVKQEKRDELQKAIQIHTGNPAYHAFIRMKEIAGEKANGGNESQFKRRDHRVIDLDEHELMCQPTRTMIQSYSPITNKLAIH